jgi:hypothetical protein
MGGTVGMGAEAPPLAAAAVAGTAGSTINSGGVCVQRSTANTRLANHSCRLDPSFRSRVVVVGRGGGRGR